MDQLLLITGLTAATVGFLAPWAAAGFVVTGAIAFYTALHLAGIPNFAALTGTIFSALGTAALVRLTIRGWREPWNRHVRVAGILFLAFVAIWYVRWYQDPPRSPDEGFGSRAPALMVAFAVVPFLTGLSASTPQALRKLLLSIAVWGMLGASILAAFWLLGTENFSTHEDRWQPLPSLTTIVMALDLAVGYFAATEFLRRPPVRWALAAPVGALMFLIGQRGPFIFFAVAVLARSLLESRKSIAARWAIAGAVAGVLALGAVVLAANEDAGRIVSADRYSAEGNEDRLALFEIAAAELPKNIVFGLGGSLVGMPVGKQEWDYIHVTMLDPLLETGLVGALPFWSLFALTFLWAWQALRGRGARRQFALLLAPLFLLVFLEGQVSGHVSGAKHLWLITGALISVSVRRAFGSEPAPADRKVPVQAVQAAF